MKLKELVIKRACKLATDDKIKEIDFYNNEKLFKKYFDLAISELKREWNEINLKQNAKE